MVDDVDASVDRVGGEMMATLSGRRALRGIRSFTQQQ